MSLVRLCKPCDKPWKPPRLLATQVHVASPHLSRVEGNAVGNAFSQRPLPVISVPIGALAREHHLTPLAGHPMPARQLPSYPVVLTWCVLGFVQYYFETLFPRVPKPVQDDLVVKLGARGLPTKAIGNAGQGGADRRGVEEPNRRPASVKVGLVCWSSLQLLR